MVDFIYFAITQVGYLADVLLERLVWLADLVSGFVCNTMVMVDASSNPPLFLEELLMSSTKLTIKRN